MRKGRRNLQVLLVGAILMVVGISVAFAALSTALNITTNSVTSLGSPDISWNIGFTGTSATATVGGTSATGRSCGTATITATSVTVGATTLSKPDDSCTYTLTIKNSGTITGTLASITPTKPTGTNVTCGTASGSTMVCGNITYKLTTDSTGSTALTTGGQLAANGTRTIYLVIKYTGSSLNSSAVTQSSGSFAITYNQT